MKRRWVDYVPYLSDSLGHPSAAAKHEDELPPWLTIGVRPDGLSDDGHIPKWRSIVARRGERGEGRGMVRDR